MEVLNRIPRSEYRPIDLRLLSQTPPREHLVDDGDILGVYIEGAPGSENETMPVRLPDDRFVAPTVGFPTPVRNGGYIRVPQIGVLHVRGMTVWQIEERIREILTRETNLVQPDRTRIHVSLMWKRSVNVMVVRQEEVSATQLIAPTNGSEADRRSGQVVQLPAFQNDVLHALMTTGGLPNDQAENAVYVFKRHDRQQVGMYGPTGQISSAADVAYGRIPQFPTPTAIQLAAWSSVVQNSASSPPGPPLQQVLAAQTGHSIHQPLPGPLTGQPPGMSQRYAGSMYPTTNNGSMLPQGGRIAGSPDLRYANPAQMHTMSSDPMSRHPNAVRIPLTAVNGQPLAFGQQDIILEEGDIILVESREQDHFFTGGLLGGGQYALPRNTDLDVIDAVLLADSYSRSTQLNTPTRAIGGVSVLNRDVTVGASRVIIERTGPDGHKRRFRVSLYHAMKNPDQRVLIEPGDRIFLEYTSAEAFLAFIERHLLDPFLTGAPQLLSDDLL